MYELKIVVSMDEESDIKYWGSEQAQKALLSDLQHKFDLPKENIDIKFSLNIWSGEDGKETLKFLQMYAKELDEKFKE